MMLEPDGLVRNASGIFVTKKPTIAVVAKEAGVAVSTVSRYLNGHYVSRAVRARLSDVISTLGSVTADQLRRTF